MSNEFRGTGNVGEVAPLKQVSVGAEQRQVTQLRVFFDEYRQNAAAGNEPAGGFWLDVNVWGERLAAEVAQHVKKGARVHVVGRLTEHRWTVTATNEARRALTLNADQLYLGLARVEEVKLKSRRETGGASA